MPVLRLAGVRLDYPGRPGVLQDVDLAVPAGRLAVLQGRSGSGKSSLLAVAAGLEVPTTGQVHVKGEPMAGDAAARSRLRSRHVGLVFQHLNLLGELSVAENVELPLRLRGMPRAQRQERVRALLERFQIDDLAQRRPGSLSGGEQQRTAIARALAPGPALLLVDEPTSNLDEGNARTVIEALVAATKEGAAVVVATHDPLFAGIGRTFHLVAGRLATRPTAPSPPDAEAATGSLEDGRQAPGTPSRAPGERRAPAPWEGAGP